MGKSAPFCLKILACGSRTVDHDDVQVTDSKGSSDRRGWSFPKRSARHRVLTDDVDEEVPQSANKENNESKAVRFQVEAGLDNMTEKTPLIQLMGEENVASTQHESKISNILAADEDNCEEYCTFDDARVTKIQASIRGFLARILFFKEKSIITNLQATVRGHLVRRQAVGALWCVQAIIRIQAHVRAQRALMLIDSNDCANKADKEVEPHSRCTCGVSIEKLLTNAFANHVMESLPRPKCISIKCEPKLDSWKWLEIWTSVSTVGEEHQEPESVTIKKSGEGPEDSGSIDDSVAAPCSPSETTKVKPEFPSSTDGSEGETNAIDSHAESFNTQYHPVSNVTEFCATEVKETDLNGIEAANCLSDEESGSEGMKNEPEMLSPEQLNTAVNRFSKNASNLAFITAEVKFEDPTTLKSTSFTSYDQYYSATDQSVKSTDKVLDDSVTSSTLAPRIGDSECGIEFSISSTVDSSDGSECGLIEIHPETGIRYSTNHAASQEVELDPPYPEPEAKELEEDITLLIENTPMVNRNSSPENSPRSRMSQITVPESQATPSRQVSVSNSNKKSEGKKSESHAKIKAHSNLNPDSALRNNMEHSQENKSRGTTRNSSGSAKHDHEPRDTAGTSNSLPGYMQATESTKTKSMANGSPKSSSPDVQVKDTFIKKRQSFPGSSERHVFPRLSQVQENAKGNNTKSPQDRKWLR